jgi:hypothetical protein
VQVAFDPAPGGVGGRDDPGPRSRELCACVGISNHGGDQVREVPDARLGIPGVATQGAAIDRRLPGGEAVAAAVTAEATSSPP